jgi:hypothetical protein
MREVKLPGLQVGNPVGFMAALGLLRILNEDHGLEVTLAWQDGHAMLGGIDEDGLLTLLNQHMRGRSRAPEFNFAVNTGSDRAVPVMHLREIRPEDYQAAAAQMVEDSRALGFLAGFATDTVVNENGFVARTSFDFSSANQKLAEEFRRLALRLDPDARRGRKETPSQTLLQQGLFGGPYVEQHSFGWDPATPDESRICRGGPHPCADTGTAGPDLVGGRIPPLASGHVRWAWQFADHGLGRSTRLCLA